MNTSPRFRYAEWVRRHRRAIGIPLVAAALWLMHLDRQYLLASIALVSAGELIRIWAAGHLRKEQVLTTGGPYRWIRNPLYLGSFLIAGGFSLVAGSPWIWAMVLAYFLLCYIPVIRYEEGILQQKFPEEYPDYAKRIPALYPTFRLYPHSSTRFSFQQALKNKEYNAVLGILVVYLLLFLR